MTTFLQTKRPIIFVAVAITALLLFCQLRINFMGNNLLVPHLMLNLYFLFLQDWEQYLQVWNLEPVLPKHQKFKLMVQVLLNNEKCMAWHL
jgi:hypothetical protein